jgi:CubicO group peptidase (beta-lactamase class C family)
MAHRRKFIKQIGWSGAGLGLYSLLPGAAWASATTIRATASAAAAGEPGNDLFLIPRSSPEQQGVSSAGILRFLDAIRDSGQEFHSIMIIRHGHVIAEGWWYPYSSGRRQQLYSLSKSFTGTAIGLAVDEKRLTVEDTVLSFFPDAAPAAISDNLAALKVKHLLSMSVGHAKDSIQIIEKPAPGDTWEKTFLSLPVADTPGTKFLYNSGASYMLSSIVKKITGYSAHEYLGPRLYDPLGIVGATWTENEEGVNIGASHLRIRTEDIAKLGQLYLQKGVWNKKRILSEAWVATASEKHMENGKQDSAWGYGYGYQFWMNPTGGFRADGAYGQYSMVFPDSDTVVAITSESADKAATMRTVWDTLVPELKGSAPLSEDPNTWTQLKTSLGALTYTPPQFNKVSPMAATLSGKKFILDENPFFAKTVSFSCADDHVVFTLTEAGKPDIVINCGMNRWILDGNRKPEAHSMFSLRRIDFDSVVAASAGWSAEDTLVLTFRFIETCHGDSLTCTFDKDGSLRIKFLFSAARLEKRPDDRADITGKIMV